MRDSNEPLLEQAGNVFNFPVKTSIEYIGIRVDT